jgi:predicted nucleic acid-binding protein
VREAELVLGAGWLGRMASRERVASLLEALRSRTVWVDAPELITDLDLKDEGDVRMVETAVSGGASYVVTTDREFLWHRGYGNVEFVTPVEALRVLG